MKKYEIIATELKNSWGVFNTIEEAYEFAVNHISFMKMACGDIYIPYEIVEVEVHQG